MGLLFGVPAATIASGAYGSNAALTAMVLGKLFVVLEAGGVGYALGGALLTAVALWGCDDGISIHWDCPHCFCPSLRLPG